MQKKRKDFTVHTSVPTEAEKMYLNMLTPYQRLAVLVQAGKQHQDQLLLQDNKKSIRTREIRVYETIENLEEYGMQGLKLFHNRPYKGTYWLSVSESGICIGGVSDFYDQNGIEFDADGLTVSEWPVNGTELSAKFEIKEEE